MTLDHNYSFLVSVTMIFDIMNLKKFLHASVLIVRLPWYFQYVISFLSTCSLDVQMTNAFVIDILWDYSGLRTCVCVELPNHS